MAGTDRRRGRTKGGAPGMRPDAPAIILVRPQLAENIGAAARAMLNCGHGELRLVAPRAGWPNPAAEPAAAGAVAVLDRARLFATTEEATADLNYVLATTARLRDQVKPVLDPETAAAGLHARRAAAPAMRSGILFGGERSGLVNDDIARANAILEVALNPGFASLNLAQAVLLVAYQWWQARPLSDMAPASDQPGSAPAPAPERLETGAAGAAAPAPKAELDALLDRLESELAAGGFFPSAHLRPTTVRNLRNFFQRAEPTDQEVRTWHGVISALIKRGRNQTREGAAR